MMREATRETAKMEEEEKELIEKGGQMDGLGDQRFNADHEAIVRWIEQKREVEGGWCNACS